ncbi:response regulator [Aurantivibrio infirmus]
MINVLLIDDQTLVRQGIRSLLELSDSAQVVAELEDGSEVLHVLAKQKVDIILLDLQMPKMSGIQVLEELRNSANPTPVIVLTTFNDDEQLFKCAKLGARGFMLKDVSFEQLITAIKNVSAGELIIQETVSQNLLRGLKSQAKNINIQDVPEPLTPREREVIQYMAGGFSNREIGTAIHLSEGTVKNHVSSILAKLGVRDRTRAVIKALDLGLIQ